jgi:3D (Asp-Asp-Asp) domain-containing protein
MMDTQAAAPHPLRTRCAAVAAQLSQNAPCVRKTNAMTHGGQTMSMESMHTDMDWGNAVVIDPKRLNALAADVHTLRRGRMFLRSTLVGLALVASAVSLTAYDQAERLSRLSHEVHEQRKSAERSSLALATLARSHQNILSATTLAPSVGTKSWGRRFIVTKYLPTSPAYGKFNTGRTSTLLKADPKARIVAVDPKVIPYGSWIWIEGLGWYQAQDCGAWIKGFRLDVLTATEKEALEYGKQERFAIVVPPDPSTPRA